MFCRCTAPGHGARLIPAGTLTGVHFLETPHYTQVTGTGNLKNLNIQAGDAGGGNLYFFEDE